MSTHHFVGSQHRIPPQSHGMGRRDCDHCQHSYQPNRPTQRYCSQACVRAVLRLKAMAHNRQLAQEREAKRKQRRAEVAKTGVKAEAAKTGVNPADLLTADQEAYWRKVEDPNYYTGLRYAPGSCLRGENPCRTSGITLGRRDESGFYGGDRGRGR